MKTKSEGKRRTCATVTTPSFSAIPHLSGSLPPFILSHSHEPVDFFDKTICICCDNNNRRESPVLVCHVSDCPVVVHATCIGSEPKFDDSGNFYCPYCWYKRALDTCRHLRDKVIVAKNALSGFLDNKARARQKPVQDTEQEENVEKTVSEENKDVEEYFEKGECEGIEDEQAMEDCVEKGECEGNKDELAREEYVEDAESECEENKNEGKGFVSVMGSSVSEADSESVSVKKRKDQKKVVSVGRKKSLLPEEPKHYSSRGKVASGMDEEEVTSSRTLRPRQRSPAKGKKQSLLTANRRRLLWTAEEEKVLKEGVLKFATENQNIPWRKILEFGCRVFDKTRTPVDLKDKWRNITKYG